MEQYSLDTQLFLELSQSAYYKGSDTFVALSEPNRKRKHQSLRINAKLGLLFNDDSGDGRLDNFKRQFYPGEYQAGPYKNQGSKNYNETPDQQSSRLTGTTLVQSTPSLNTLSATPKDDFLVEGYGSIVII